MRYVVLKKVVSKIFDDILDDPDEIFETLSSLKEKEITCSMQIKSGPVHDFVRIVGINKEASTFVWRLIKNGTSLRKTSSIDDVNSISIEVDDEITIKVKPNPSRFSTLDPSDI